MDKRYQIVLVVGFTVAFAIMSFGFTANIFMWESQQHRSLVIEDILKLLL